MDDEVQRFLKIKEKLKKADNSKIRIEERYKHEREKLETLIAEIKSKGYDPSKLAEIKQKKEQELLDALNKIEKDTNEVTQKLSEIENQST
jgi:hypothetical protein